LLLPEPQVESGKVHSAAQLRRGESNHGGPNDTTKRNKRYGNDAPWKAWKTQKAEFPTLSTALGNPAKDAGFPHFHSARGEDFILRNDEEKDKTAQITGYKERIF
jgi:hypothetical protein